MIKIGSLLPLPAVEGGGALGEGIWVGAAVSRASLKRTRTEQQQPAMWKAGLLTWTKHRFDSLLPMIPFHSGEQAILAESLLEVMDAQLIRVIKCSLDKTRHDAPILFSCIGNGE